MSAIRAHLKALLGAALLASGGVAARAQSVSDFRLPPGTGPATPRPQGPVDPERPPPPPVASTQSPSPVQPAPVAIPTAAPARVVVPPPPAVRPPVPITAPRPATSAAPPSAPPAPAATLPAASVPEAAPAVPSAAPAAVIATAAPAVAATDGPPANTSDKGERLPWLWLVGAALVLGGIGAALLWRRRTQAATAGVPQQGQSDSAQMPPLLLDEPASAGPVTVMSTESAPTEPEQISVALEPLRFSVSLVNATLLYRLRLTNLGAHAIGPVAIAADMIGAHASLSDDSQLGRDGSGFELRHELAALGPGESAELQGELRLPLADVTPIRNGIATLIVPLVRMRVEGPGIMVTRAVVVGESPVEAGGLLRPFRLDTGPKIFPAVSQRDIPEAA